MNRSGIAASLALFTLVAVAPSSAQQFEGVITIRTAHLTSDIVTGQIGEDADDRARENVFAMTMEQYAQVGGPVN